jgi:hypothetical protein
LKYFFTISFLIILHTTIFSQDTQRLQKPNDSTLSKQAISAHADSIANDTSLSRINKDQIQPEPFDSLVKDSVNVVMNTISDSAKNDSLNSNIVTTQKKSEQKKNVIQLMQGTKRNVPDRDILFYILIFLLFFLGLIKTSFPKYVNSIFSLSFQATFRQTQTREQMSYNVYPAFMLNFLFVLCGGLFITLFAEFNNWSKFAFWQLFVYSTGILLIVYVVKYAVISFTGWVFNAKEAAAEYRFVVFLINKLLGIFVIPLLFLIAYSNAFIQNISVTIVICLAIFSLAVRYLVSLARIRKNLSITAFHFFIYLCAVEIIPLLVIYKLLFLQAGNR